MRFDLPARVCAVVLVVLASGPSSARAQDAFQQGLDAYLSGEYRQALELWRPAAASGNEVAAFNVGVLYARGLGVDQDPAEAVKWYRQSALAGYANAQFNLGAAYYNGTGVERNTGQALSWWEKAAAQQHPEAIYNLAALYRDGKVVEQDVERALQLFEKGAALGDARAKAALARLADRADLAEQPSATAAQEPGQAPDNEAASQPRSQVRSESAWPDGENPDHWAVQIFAVTKEAAARRFVTDNGLADTVRIYRADVDGRTWFKGITGSYPDQAAAQAARDRLAERLPGSSPWIRPYRAIQAEAVATVLLDEGATEQAAGSPGTGEDDEAATRQQASSDDEAMKNSGTEPSGVIGDVGAPAGETSSASTTQTDDGSTSAAGGGDVDEQSQAAAAVSVEESTGEDGGAAGWQVQLRRGQRAFNAQDYDVALEAWRPLAEQGVAAAQYGIGFMYESGWGVEKDFSEAYRWYQLAAQQGHVKSQFNLGMLYRNGKGVAENNALALYWIQTAADRGDERAVEYLKDLN